MLNGVLEDKKFLEGDLTLADFSVGVWLGNESKLKLPVSEFGHVQHW